MKKQVRSDTSLYVLVVLSLLSTIAAVVFGVLNGMQVTGQLVAPMRHRVYFVRNRGCAPSALTWGLAKGSYSLSF